MAGRRAAKTKRAPSSTPSGKTRLMLEAVDKKLDLVIEMVSGLPTREELDARFRAIEARLDVLEAIARDHALRLERIEADLRSLRADFEEERRARRGDLAAIERRVAVLEAKLGITPA